MSRTALAIVALLGLLALTPANAQQSGPGAATNELFNYFYKDPRPERLIGFLPKYDAAAPRWDGFPPAVGFFAFVFQTYPGWIDRLIPDQLTARTAPTVMAALRLSGNDAKAQALRARLTQPTPDQRLAAELAGLPGRLEDLRITTPTHLDILWGASFASGDPRFVRIILQYVAATANRSEPIAIDVASLAIATASGRAQETFGAVRGKYGDAVAVQILYAATALWGVESNARQHPFIAQAVAKYIGDNPGTPAAKAFASVRPRGSAL